MSEKRKHLTDEEWIPVGQEYCAGIAVNRLSKKYGISRPAIANAIRRYHWQRDPLLQEAIAVQQQRKCRLPLPNKERLLPCASARSGPN